MKSDKPKISVLMPVYNGEQFLDKSINSINFSIDVVNDKAYISGVATDELEMNLVKSHASSARFIKEVYNYIILNKDTR